MDKYVCHYAVGDFRSALEVYHADTLAQAMASHNAALPEFADKVLKWVGPTGINFLMHDSRLTLEEDTGCPGHYDTDDALTSGIGIGESVYCDGTCNG